MIPAIGYQQLTVQFAAVWSCARSYIVSLHLPCTFIREVFPLLPPPGHLLAPKDPAIWTACGLAELR